MLEFTHDADWQEERAAKWKAVEDEIKEGLTRKRIREVRTYYMTGVIPDGVVIKPWDAIELYPDPSIEGLQHCLRVNFPDGMTKKEFEDTQVILSLALSRLKQLSKKQQAELFRYVAGDTFDPNRRFPFYIGQETKLRRLAVPPFEYFLSAMLEIVFWVKDTESSEPEPFWIECQSFILSLLPYLPSNMFTFQAGKKALTRKPGHRDRTAVKYLWKLLRYCLSPPQAADDSEDGKKRQKFLKEFRARFEALEEYPGDLKAIWREIQIQEGIVKSGPIENIWRKTTRRGVPNGQSD
ncbi:hypothetical protein CF392_14330 [Tamilnaduibacter salinus]|uniref:Uncharacterized protein n=1 Tax=Tamilnaduibacter salinus TaxID=1484056 RepID=A0A2A2HZI3_9GAMM|nr:hypothetical protein [Tamilnaduibacter salinus]PAV24777.1 hypothetical protein CF392_14330 [Tamilnaduibacter salinus]